jgi:hypothetical protein
MQTMLLMAEIAGWWLLYIIVQRVHNRGVHQIGLDVYHPTIG